MCERLWIFRFSRREKLLLQVGQRCGFSFVCVRMWISILYLPGLGQSQNRGMGWEVLKACILQSLPAMDQDTFH